MKAKGTTRLNLEISAEVRGQLEVLQTRTSAASLTEVIRRSLAVYDCFTEYSTQGWEVVLRHPSKGTKVVKVLV